MPRNCLPKRSAQKRKNPFLFTPHSRAIRPSSLTHARVKERAPILAVVALEGTNIMADIKEATGLGAVDDLIKGVGLSGGRICIERNVLGGEKVVVVVVTASLVADVLVGGAAVFGGERRRSGLGFSTGFNSEVGLGLGGFGSEKIGFLKERVDGAT
ncbi:hypothetical protein Lal_00009819 [Lupinus albus]|nr:hypothetical protein Lal_00009819 [Lupinus albus]